MFSDGNVQVTHVNLQGANQQSVDLAKEQDPICESFLEPSCIPTMVIDMFLVTYFRNKICLALWTDKVGASTIFSYSPMLNDLSWKTHKEAP